MKNQVFIHKTAGSLAIDLSNIILYCGYYFNEPTQAFYNFYKPNQLNINDPYWIDLDD